MSEQRAASGARVLIVDDDLDTLKLVGLLLQRQGYTVMAANSGAKALQKAQEEQPDLILLDVMMPDMDGYEVARRLRMDPNTASIPILMFTAKSQVDDKLTGFEAGADDYITKPAHPAELLARVKRLLARPRSGSLKPAQVSAAPQEQAKVVLMLGAKGGVGLTTLALNLAILLRRESEQEMVTLVELRPGQGTLPAELDITEVDALPTLLRRESVTPEDVEAVLIKGPGDVHVLPGSLAPEDVGLLHVKAVGRLYHALRRLPGIVLLDLGPGLPTWVPALLPTADKVLVVLDNIPQSLPLAQGLITSLRKHGVPSAQMGAIYVQRVPLGVQPSLEEVQAALGIPVLKALPPAVELLTQATRMHTPMVIGQPKALYTAQLADLAGALHKALIPVA